MTTNTTRVEIALGVPPVLHIPLRGPRSPIPITVERLSLHPVQVTVTADVPAVPGGEKWGFGRPIATLSLNRMGERQTVMWVPALLPNLPTYHVLIRAGGVEAVVQVIGAPGEAESEITSGFPGYDPRSPAQYVQLAFDVRPPAEIRITSSSVKQLIANAFQISQAQARPTFFRLWASAERQGGIAMVWHYLLHVEYQGDLRDMSQFASALDRAAGLVGLEIRSKIATWGD